MPRKKVATRQNRGPRGAGSVFYDKRRKQWVGKVPVGRDPDTGRLVYEYVRAKTQARAVELAAAKRPAEVVPTMTLAAWSKRWLESLTQKPQTRDDYDSSFRHRVLPSLGAKPLAKITTWDVEQAAREWGKSVGAGTVRKTVAALSAAMQAAHRAALVPANPVRAARRPTAPPARFDLFTADEVRRILAACLAAPELHPFAVCAATGCRIGEALSLRADDYDPKTGLLSFRRTRTRSHGHGTPKSRHGTRTVRAPLAVRAILPHLVGATGYTTAHRRWHMMLERLGVRARGTHQLRHTWATYAIANGAPIADVAKYLGDSVQMIVNTYMHASGADPSEVIDRLLESPDS